MAGISLLIELLRKKPALSNPSVFHSSNFFSSVVAASAAAASVAASRPFASSHIAYCDAGAAVWGDDYISNLHKGSESIFYNEASSYRVKEYPIELKPLFSAFGLKALTMTTIRALLMFYLPLLEPRSHLEEDDEDFPSDSEDERVDLVTPLKKSVKQIFRESAVVTTRRVLERISVHYISQRMAWKLLKDLPKSAKRKAGRGMPTLVFFHSVTKSTFRGHFLAVAASWLVQVGIDIYRCISVVAKNTDAVVRSNQVQFLGKKIVATTVRCSSSLVFASIGAGLGATICSPSAGQWIGCAVGDLAGPFIVAICIDRFIDVEL
ncbi:hypothetical protein EJ110_NYTH27848 [Nymphaea thermarum]|nr:hypothetical protein EJ110_NYTH27848 [Nymphaea thermarum]